MTIHGKTTSQTIPKTNPRFVWNIGSIQEAFTDMPGPDEKIVLWDRQEREPVITVHEHYRQAICLELSNRAENFPFTNLENWFNNLTNRDLKSENLKPTKRSFRK